MDRRNILEKIIQNLELETRLTKEDKLLTIEALKKMYQQGDLQRLAQENGIDPLQALVACVCELGLNDMEAFQAILYIIGMRPHPPELLD